MSDSGEHVFCCGKTTDESCPTWDGTCDCGWQETELAYGITGYGLGTHELCTRCWKVYNFEEDEG